MIGRLFATSLTFVLGAGLIFGSAETAAKPGGFSAKGKGFYAGPAFRRAAPRSVFLPPVVPPFRAGNPSASPARLLQPPVSYRRFYGYGLPAAGVGVYYGLDSIAPGYFQPAFMTPAGGPVIRYADVRRRCGSETQIVPSEDGGERSITIKRC